MRLLVLALVLLAACNATETGNPSNAPTIGFGSIDVRSDSPPMPADPSPLVVTGAPGTVEPGGGEMVAFNLDTRDPEVVTTIAADGSFQLAIAASPTQVVRLQAIGERYSEPTDLRVPPSSGVADLEPEPCLRAAPATVIGEATVELASDCDASIANVTATFRSTGASLEIANTIDGTFTLSIPAVAARDVLLVVGDVGGEPLRVAITVVP